MRYFYRTMRLAAPDSYTLGRGNGGAMVIVPHAFKKAPYDALKDFTPVAPMATNFMGLTVGNASSARTVGERIQHAQMNTWTLDVITESPDYFANDIRADHARYGRIAKDIGLKAQ